MNKKELTIKFKSMSSLERKALILKKLKALVIDVVSGIHNKKYDNKEIYELIHIAKCLPELRKNN